jgi:hypothetical protein
MRHVLQFIRVLPKNVRMAGGVLNPWLWHAVRASWLSTGPPLPPLDISDEEADAFLAAIEEM